MRIVTRNAGNACVACPPALAVLQPVRLRPHRRYSAQIRQFDVPPRGKARPAEVNGITGRKRSSVEYEFAATGARYFALLRSHVFRSGPVTRLARKAVGKLRLLKDRLRRHARRVALETAAHLFSAKRPGHGFRNVAW